MTLMETWANPNQMERAAKVPVDNLPWTSRSVRAFCKRKLNIAGISHSLLSEKRDTDGGGRSPSRAGFFVRDRQGSSAEIAPQRKLGGWNST